jgi:hypothetical protein
MTALEELIETANRLCNNLEIASNNEVVFNTNVCIQLERYSWDVYRMMNDIKAINEYCS